MCMNHPDPLPFHRLCSSTTPCGAGCSVRVWSYAHGCCTCPTEIRASSCTRTHSRCAAAAAAAAGGGEEEEGGWRAGRLGTGTTVVVLRSMLQGGGQGAGSFETTHTGNPTNTVRAVVAPNSSVMITVQALGGFKEWPLLEDVDMAQRYAPPPGEGRGCMAHWCMQRCTAHCCIEGRGWCNGAQPLPQQEESKRGVTQW